MNQNNSQGFDFLDIITLLSFMIQIENNEELKKQTSTDEIYAELRRQDMDYLEKIIENQNQILNRLAKLEGKFNV